MILVNTLNLLKKFSTNILMLSKFIDEIKPVVKKKKLFQNAFQLSFVLHSWLFKIKILEFPCGSVETNPAGIHEDVSLIPGRTQWVGDLALPWAVV